MSRYIDADDLIAKWYRTSVRGRTEFDQVIMNMPTIDLTDYVPKDFHDKTCEEMAKRHQEEIANMVSVVRCKECLYWRAHETWSECERWTDDPYESAKTKADDFCSCGEREGE